MRTSTPHPKILLERSFDASPNFTIPVQTVLQFSFEEANSTYLSANTSQASIASRLNTSQHVINSQDKQEEGDKDLNKQLITQRNCEQQKQHEERQGVSTRQPEDNIKESGTLSANNTLINHSIERNNISSSMDAEINSTQMEVAPRTEAISQQNSLGNIQQLFQVMQDTMIASMNKKLEEMKKEFSEEIQKVGPQISSELRGEIDQMGTKTSETASKVEQLETENKKRDEKMAVLEDKVTFYENRFRILQQVLDEQEGRLKQCEKLKEQNAMDRKKNLLYIMGLSDVTEQNGAEKVKNFFIEQMSLTDEICITKVYRRSEDDKWITVVLKNPSNKGKIFACVKNLKGKKNGNGKSFQIRDNKSQRIQEENRRNKEIKKMNDKATVAEQLQLTLEKKHLFVVNENGKKKYEQPLKCPSRLDILKMDALEAVKLRGIEVTEGPVIQTGGSKFKGVVVDVGSIAEVNDAYKLIHYKNMEADHIICACKVPAENKVEREQYHDDGDYGLGRALWEYMDDLNMTSRAIFVVRETDGVHIGNDRFDTMIQAARTAVNVRPLNKRINKFQFSWPVRGASSHRAGQRRTRYERVLEKYPAQEHEMDAETSQEDNV